ncbi:hypothetical protein CCU68_33840 [Pseudomonas gingeri NCPPB 3146 = LMG 5327]|uniref:Uncharacterized protein n=1 Tax=Pseudomonas gingeri NCPPB 3146 = LMG 5327 TaxID=707248 RepID=A0ABX4XT83_9PSED|nr:hypothetical protein CCU68_33840 [Pseudomonas gingeri NCPPB 3146 = LMG 5327]
MTNRINNFWFFSKNSFMDSPFEAITAHPFIPIQPRNLSKLPQPYLIKRGVDVGQILFRKRIYKSANDRACNSVERSTIVIDR